MGSHWNTCVYYLLIMKDVQECYQRPISSAFHYFWSFFVLSSQETGKAWELIMRMMSDGCEMDVGKEGSTLKQHTWLHHQVSIAWLVSSPDPTCERWSGDIRLIPRASLILITFWREIFSLPITLLIRQSVVLHRKFLATSARWHSTFLGT